MHLSISFTKWRPFRPGGDELIYISLGNYIATLSRVYSLLGSGPLYQHGLILVPAGISNAQ